MRWSSHASNPTPASSAPCHLSMMNKQVCWALEGSSIIPSPCRSHNFSDLFQTGNAFLRCKYPSTVCHLGTLKPSAALCGHHQLPANPEPFTTTFLPELQDPNLVAMWLQATCLTLTNLTMLGCVNCLNNAISLII